jgi:hypothetical protein
MLAEATREAERIVQQARERQQSLISEDEVTKQAELAAEDISRPPASARSCSAPRTTPTRS